MSVNENQKTIVSPQRFPANGTFELTVRCDLKCKMCLFRHDDSENADIMAKELTAAQWIDLAKQVAEAGTINLLITGGEPMLRPDFCEIWEGIYKEGFILELYTNGTLVTPKIMETLRRYPPHRIGVTLYGLSAETYERACGNGAMFEKAIAGFKQLQTLPSKMEFRTTIIKDNYCDFKDMYDFIEEEFGEEYRLTHTRLVTQSVRGACADVNTCRLDPEDNVMLSFERSIDLIKDFIGDEYRPEYVRFEQKDLATDNTIEPKITLFGCDAGMTQYTITWDGKLTGCQLLDIFHTDPIKDGFEKAWDEFPYTVRIPSINEKCTACENRQYCNSCAASRYAETGDVAGCPTYVCKDVEAMQRIVNKGHL